MLKLGSVQQISDETGTFGNFYANGVFDCPHRGQGMGVRSDPAGPLNKMMGVLGVAAEQNQLDTPEHLSGAPGVGDLAARNFYFNPKVTLDPGDRINGDSFFCHMETSF